MRRVIAGNGQDNTAAAVAYLAANKTLILRDLILIGAPEDPRSIWLTNHEAPVIYSPWGRFNTAVVKRDMVQCKIGTDAQSLSITWSPNTQATGTSISSASVAQLARLHFYDNWPVRIWRALMPTPGDADTLGCVDWFGGRIDTVSPKRNQIVFNVKSFLDVLTQKVPSTVIETTNTLASTAAVTLPPGDPSIPVFECVAGSTENYIIANCTAPSAGKIYPGNQFAGGYMVFLSGTGALLPGFWSAIGQNGMYTSGLGEEYSQFEIYASLPWPPAPGADNFYVSMTPPLGAEDGDFYGFPYVPNPQSGV
jgi:hypothetical protein